MGTEEHRHIPAGASHPTVIWPGQQDLEQHRQELQEVAQKAEQIKIRLERILVSLDASTMRRRNDANQR
jgi:hypothetical protein